MLFNSLHFALFFPVVLLGHFLLPFKHRWWWLLGASCYFYASFVPAYLLILLGTVLVDYFAAQWMQGKSPATRKVLLMASLSANLGILFFFKYWNFALDLLHPIFQATDITSPTLQVLLPIGLSFHTLQSMGYVIEVYFGRQEPQGHFGKFWLYVMFFPQLVAGPIERPQNLLPQFELPSVWHSPRVVDGLRLMLIGFFKKLVIADRFAVLADAVFNQGGDYTGPVVALGTLAFAVQIFCDFSGYTDIARGAARIMGFELMINFKQPYLATSVSGFWRRWHISLSSWLRDYLYIPLGGNRLGVSRAIINVLIVFAVSGLWHGAALTFVCWGLWHGAFIMLEMLKRWALPSLKTPAWMGVVYTSLVVVLSWIFFRANSIDTALSMFAALGHGWSLESLQPLFVAIPTRTEWALMGALFVGLLVSGVVAERVALPAWLAERPLVVRWGLYYALVLGIIFFGAFGSRSFIYFQF